MNIYKLFLTILSWIFWFFLIILLALTLAWLVNKLIPKDYCFEQHRKLTDKEYIAIVLKNLIKSKRIQLYDSDNTVESYLARHPKCCRVYRNGDSSYDGAPEVQIIYELNEELKEQYHATHYENVTWLSACGKPFESTGMELSNETANILLNKNRANNLGP